MGFFDFIKDAGKKLLGGDDDAKAIKDEIAKNSSTMAIDGLNIELDGDIVKITGEAANAQVAAKAALIAGNIAGVTQVDVGGLTNIDEEAILYVIQEGDTLWKVATIFYKNGARYTEIVDANKEVIIDADKIYPGQTIVIPNFNPED